MSNNYNEKSRADRVRWIVTVISLVLVAVLSVGLLCVIFVPRDNSTADATVSKDGAVLSETVEDGVSLMSAKIMPTEYAANGVSALADTAYTLTATVEPDYEGEKTFDWTIEFQNPASSWASGKTVTDYVTVTPTSDGANTATVECKQAFAEKIIVTCTSRDYTASEHGAQVRIEAYVYPENAANREVDYTVKWGEAPEHGSEEVTDYLTVTPESDCSRIASVVCKKAFDDDTILITATTRDGGFTATCTVRFVGIAEVMAITSSDAEKMSSAERGEYYVLGTNKTYTFDVVLSNLFDDVQSELSVEVSGAGALYFGNGSYNDGGYLNYTNVVQRDLSELADKFITSAELSGTTLTVKTGSQVVENYYSSWGPDEDYVTEIFYDRYVVEVRDDTMGFKTAGDTFNNQNAKYNAENIGSCYFTVTVKDEVSGLSQSIRL